MEKHIYIFGHQSPDTDSICSTIAYTEFKKKLGFKNIKAYRLGNINKETQFILDYFNINIPELLIDIKPKLSDVSLYKPLYLNENESLKKAWLMLKDSKESKIVIVLNQDKNFIGILSFGDITKFFMNLHDNDFRKIYDKPIKDIMITKDIEQFCLNDYIDDVLSKIKISTHRNFPIIDENKMVIGILSNSHLIDYKKKNVILIDHNEMTQSVLGLDKANILEVIDHHRVANIQTEAPLLMRLEPVGCTSTIIFKIYNENNIDISKNIAGIMLSAILSDTLIFTSPTCTEEDINAAKKLASIAGIMDIKSYGEEMFKAGTSLENYTSDAILEIDRKCFNFNNYCVYISQVNTMDKESINIIKDSLIESMENFQKDKKCDLVILMITDIINCSSELLFIGSATHLLEKGLGINKLSGSIYLDGVVSRKKQIVPMLICGSK